MENNPLQKYFRQPAVYIRLPSGGNFYPPGTLEKTPNNEYPVLPMTTMDEITYRTPDALFNGSAIASVVQSCVPSIKNAWAMPSVDIDAVLIGIRIATYGHELDVASICPNCSNEAEYSVDLRTIMDLIKPGDYSHPLEIGDLKIFFKPMTYKQINDNSMTQFQDQKLMQAVQETVADDDVKRMEQMGEVLKKLTMATTQALCNNIALIKTPQASVTDLNHIMEWLLNCDRTTALVIREHVIKQKSAAELKPLDVKCSNCGNEYQQQYTLDMSNFFGAAS